MIMKTASSRLFVFTSAVALALLLAVANAAALTNSVNANGNASVAQAVPAKTNLKPAVASSSLASPAGEDIRDIRQPKHVPTPWFWVVVAVGIAGSLAAAFAVWAWVRQGRIFGLSPNEIALQRLEEARAIMNPEHAREYCFAVSKIIRGYVEEQLRLRAPRLTTEEFLHEIVEVPGRIGQAHRDLLGDFLQHCDLAKFAGWRYSREDLADMHNTAVEFVLQSSATPATATATAATAPALTLVNKE